MTFEETARNETLRLMQIVDRLESESGPESLFTEVAAYGRRIMAKTNNPHVHEMIATRLLGRSVKH